MVDRVMIFTKDVSLSTFIRGSSYELFSKKPRLNRVQRKNAQERSFLN